MHEHSDRKGAEGAGEEAAERRGAGEEEDGGGEAERRGEEEDGRRRRRRRRKEEGGEGGGEEGRGSQDERWLGVFVVVGSWRICPCLLPFFPRRARVGAARGFHSSCDQPEAPGGTTEEGRGTEAGGRRDGKETGGEGRKRRKAKERKKRHEARGRAEGGGGGGSEVRR